MKKENKIKLKKLRFLNPKSIFLILVIFGIFSFVKNTFAAPSISGVSGTLTDGQTITISGSNFGTKTTAAPFISSYDNATSANNWSSGTLGGGWQFSGTGGLVNTSPLRNTQYQSSKKIQYNTNGSYATVRALMNTYSQYSYISMWMYRDYTTGGILTGEGDNNKFMRTYYEDSGGNPVGDAIVAVRADSGGNFSSVDTSTESVNSPSWVVAYTAPTCAAGVYTYTMFDMISNVATCMPDLQGWEHWEWYITLPSTEYAADGSVLLLKNGMTVGRATSVGFINSGSNPIADIYYLFGMVSGQRTSSGYEYLDQIYIDNTQAHVFLSDNAHVSWPDMATAHHSEIQVPSSWSNSSITFTLNQGSFANSSQVYLYTVDASGNISNGYPITLGSSGSSDTTIPSAPTGLSVN